MNVERKKQIAEAARQYVLNHKADGMTNAQLARDADVNGAYISLVCQDKFFISGTGGRETPISDSVFQKIAATIGFVETKNYWPTIATKELKQIIVSMTESKRTGRTSMLIGESGCGKTLVSNQVLTKHPNHNYKITVNSLYNMNDLLNLICAKIGLEQSGSKSQRLFRIANKLKELRHNGHEPAIVFDESENMKQPTLAMIKSLYDLVKNHCSIQLIGTSQLLDKLEKLKAKNKEGMPQFVRRFKAGCIVLPEIDRTFSLFFEKHDLENGLKKLLVQLCDNYGELNDYLEPFLRECDEKSIAPSEDYFRKVYNIPKI